MRTSKQPSGGLAPAPATSPFRIKSNFYSRADALRLQFEQCLSLATQENAGATPLTYVFSEDQYCLLTVCAEHVFTAELLQDFIQRLRAWALDQFGSMHVSTPQIRVYITGCGREVLQDNVMLGWHYTLSLTRDDRQATHSRMRVLATDKAENRGRHFGVCEFVDSQLPFNHLLVHDTQNAYGVELSKSSMNPMKGAVLLDGYLW
jgi:hypothetical protein